MRIEDSDLNHFQMIFVILSIIVRTIYFVFNQTRSIVLKDTILLAYLIFVKWSVLKADYYSFLDSRRRDNEAGPDKKGRCWTEVKKHY